MNTHDHEMTHLQKTLQHFDVERCKLIANWLTEYIQTLEADGQLYNLPIQQLHLSTRTFNILQCNKISTVGQLIKKATDWDSIKQLKGAGEKVLTEIAEKLTQVKEGKIS
jgi:DNA-directed RNA polymerase alpha subunit